MSAEHKKPNQVPKIEVTEDGPYVVTGDIPLSKQIIATDAEGGSERWEQGKVYEVEET